MKQHLIKTATTLLSKSRITLLMALILFAILIYPGSCINITDSYDNEDKIEEVIGMELPEFSIVSSQINNVQAFDSESTTNLVLKFKTLPDKQFFHTLDSICKLEAPDTVEENSKIFAVGLESYYNMWSKDSNQYQFSIIGDPLKKTLHKEDAFFILTIKKNSTYAQLKYGNY